MNNPAYTLVDVLGEVVTAVKQAMNLPNLNYQYGYVTELNETLAQWSKTNEWSAKKFPLIWVAQPFTISRGTQGFYGNVEGLKIAIITDSNKALKAKDRMDQKFKPILYPIYNSFLEQLSLHPAIADDPNRKHKLIDRYYWGDNQKSELNDVIDCIILDQLAISIYNNSNC